MNPRIHSLAKSIRERQALLRWIRLAQAQGEDTLEGLESWYYTEGQQSFFGRYEKQMAEFGRKQNWMLHALEGVVGVEEL